MQLHVIQSLAELIQLKDEWNDLLLQSASHVPFLRHEYLTTWWQTLGGGEWSHGDLYVIAGRKPDGQLGGIAPLFFTHNQGGEPVLMLIGSHEISDYLDFIASPQDLPAFVEAVFELLATQPPFDWQVLDLFNLIEDSPTLPALQAAASRCGWKLSQERLAHCPYIPLPGDWEAYLSSIDKKQRHEIRRKMRRAVESPEPVRWYIVSDEDGLDAEIESFFSLMAQDPEKARFLTEAMRRQMRTAIQAVFEAGWLQLAFMEVDGRKAAGYLNFDYHNRIWVYNSGLNFDFRELSPGWVLLGNLLQWANEHGRQTFDFMRGDEEYKYRFGAIDRHIVRASLRRQPFSAKSPD